MKHILYKAIFRLFLIRLSFLTGTIINAISPSFSINFPAQITNDSTVILKDSIYKTDSITDKHRIDFTYDNIKNYIFRNLRYPSEAKAKEITGTVHIEFTIDTIGSIKDICIIQSAHPLLDQEAVRLIKNMPHWKPIIYKNKNQQYIYTIPIIFELKE